ncbi:hypothetical protein GOP47_0024487 [Adiantum capillus-veneris]|uniref:Uncharacterized protein n=1 Tax=Adiantum capillus-veneris TaxID=13818 RepID=A0A9D4Z4F1_ADICA|nr:hypothetical protein GOP47_0024487 [Adiantum capillus-veneris]
MKKRKKCKLFTSAFDVVHQNQKWAANLMFCLGRASWLLFCFFMNIVSWESNGHIVKIDYEFNSQRISSSQKKSSSFKLRSQGCNTERWDAGTFSYTINVLAQRSWARKTECQMPGHFAETNALATILGQTGDWDVLVAGIVVAIIELIGSFMYQKKYLSGRFKGFLIMVNYWKAGFTLGLFVDAFKVGS